MSSDTPPPPRPSTAQADRPSGTQDDDSRGGDPQSNGPQSDARYASQAAAAQPSPIAFEGGASEPERGSSGGITPRREWLFLVLATFFSAVFVSVPAVFFTSLDLTATGDEDAGAPPAGSNEALEIERLQLLQETRSDGLNKITSYGPSEEAGVFRIPVEDAMRLTLQEDYQTGASGQTASLVQAIPGGTASADSITRRQ